MALFKIFKGPAENLFTNDVTKYATEGYAYFTTDEGKMYIDTSNGKENENEPPVLAKLGDTRICLNANKADSATYDSDSQKITGYLRNIELVEKVSEETSEEISEETRSILPYYKLIFGDKSDTPLLLPEASENLGGIITTGEQTIAGSKTFNGNISTPVQINSTLADGTAPFNIASKTVNTNLNADMVDGYDASNEIFEWSTADNISEQVIPTRSAICRSLNSLLQASQALYYKGTINPEVSSTIPTSANVGDVYVFSKDGICFEQNVEAGDMVICSSTIDSKITWNIVQMNIDGAVRSNNNSSNDNAIARFDGASGKIIQDSKITIDDSGNILPSITTSQSIGSSALKFDSIYANNYYGGATLIGTPTAPTAEEGTNTTQIATTAFVTNEINKIINNQGSIIGIFTCLYATGWDSDKTQTITDSSITKNSLIIVSPILSSESEYAKGKIYCSAQGEKTLTFQATNVPTSNININIAVINGGRLISNITPAFSEAGFTVEKESGSDAAYYSVKYNNIELGRVNTSDRGTNSPTGKYAETSGLDTVASGQASAAFGTGTIASKDSQLVMGTYNADTDAVFVIGNGTSDDARSNMVELYKNDTLVLRDTMLTLEDSVNHEADDLTIEGLHALADLRKNADMFMQVMNLFNTYSPDTLTEIIDLLTNYANAGNHNSIYRGKYLGSSVTDDQYAQIAAGTFKDLYIGDYWTINSVNYRIAAFDYFYDGNAQTTHHVVMVPDTCFYTAQMETTATTTNGYAYSAMRKTNLADAKTAIDTAFGLTNHVLKITMYMCGGASSGTPTEWDPASGQVELMTEGMVFGRSNTLYSSESSISGGVTQFPLFALRQEHIAAYSSAVGQQYWLQDIAGSSTFRCVWSNMLSPGQNTFKTATSRLGVRPFFCLKG